MGAAQSSMRPAGMVLPVSYLGELGSEIQYEKSMGSSRFLKSIKARHRSGALVIKVFVKLDSHMDLRPTSKRIAAERAALADCPNVLPYSQALATERAGYLIRQWLASNLYDRISTRPFLTMIEKKWIAFQLLTALRDAHIRKVSHGDIKSENVLVTSWNWIYLTDFSSAFKPTYIPEDDPSDFSYFFDTSGRRTCYLAPERFYSQDSEIGRKKATLEVGRSLGKVTESMDVFSLGCVLAELFMEGAPPFTLAQLLQYRNGEYSIGGYLAQIEDDDVRNLIRSMTSLDPAERKTCDQYYIDEYDRSFPASFYDFFHDFVASTNEINAVDPGQSTIPHSGFSQSGVSTPQLGTNIAGVPSGPETDSGIPLATNADEIINRIYTDFETVVRKLDPRKVLQSNLEEQPHRVVTSVDSAFPVLLPLPLVDINAAQPAKAPISDGPAIIVLSLICSNLRNCGHASSILRGLDIMLAISNYLTDETKLDRLLPFVVSLFQNDAASVRAAALRTLTQTLMAIETITPSNAAIFPQYVLPNVIPFASDPDESVRCLLAQSLSPLAESGQWYLDMTQAMKAEGTFKLTRAHDFDGAPYEMSYDASLLDLQSQIHDLMNILLVDPSSAVRRALVLNVTPLCAFLGRARTADVLGLMTTHLNDRDWRLRAEFFGSMVGVSTCISVKSVDEYVLPLLAGALADPEEQVTTRELSSLATLTSLGIHQKKRLWEALFAVIPLLYHPNVWLRSGAASFVAAASKQMSETERWCCLYPGLRKILAADIDAMDELQILSALPDPVPRPVYEAALSWSIRAPDSPMWQEDATIHGMQLGRAIEAAMQTPLLRPDDKFEMQKLQTLGMSEPDSHKLLAMRRYLKQIAAMRKSTSTVSAADLNLEDLSFAEEVRLADYGVVPQNIIFSTTDNLGARFPARTLSSDGMLRSPLASDITVNTGLNDNTRTSARSVSASSTADVLRRRLAMTNASSLSVTSMTGGESPKRANVVPRPAATTTADTIGSDRGYFKDDNFDNISNSPTVVSSSNPAALSPLNRQRSRVNMYGVELSKASAAVGEDSTIATGHLTNDIRGGGTNMSGASVSNARPGSKSTGGRFHSTYEGDDPAIKQLLDRAYLDSYREPMPEFGPFIPDKVNRKRILRPGAKDRIHRCPEGTLIGNLVEHIGAVTSLAVSPDHLFFASGSADGTVKIWDTTRLEKNVTSRSRQTINQGGRITAVIPLENSHCIVSASTTGAIWVSRVDVQQQSSQMPRYGKVATIRQHLVDSISGDYATCMLHYDTDSASKLVYATMQSKIVVLDVRTLRSITTYQQPPHIGPISCMCLDRNRTWLLTGTLSGFLTLWDLRFGLQLRTWKAGNASTGAVRSCTIHNTRGKGRWVIVTLDNYEGFETWDIGTPRCVERFVLVHNTTSKEALRDLRRRRTSSTVSNQGRQTESATHTYNDNPAQAIAKLLAEAGQAKEMKAEHPHAQNEDPAAALHGFEHRLDGPAINVLLHGVDYSNILSGPSALSNLPTVLEAASANSQPAAQLRPKSGGWIISAGEDRRLVFWDLENVDKSSLIVGAEEGEDKASYGLELVEGTRIYTEIRSAGKAAALASKRGNLTAGSQQNLLRAHQDAITVLAMLDLPFRCVISADRSGTIKVWE